MFLLFLSCTLLCDDAAKDLASSSKVSTDSLIYDLISKHSKQIAELYMKSGGDVNIEISSIEFPTLLHIAVKCNDLRLIEALLQNGADINAVNKDGKTALHLAVERGYVEIIKSLLEKEVDINAVDKDGDTSLHLALWNKPFIINRNDRIEIANLLIKSNADVNVKDSDGQTALHIAIRSNNIKIIKSLLKKEVDINAVDECGSTALYLALYNRRIKTAELLIKNNIDVHKKGRYGKTALHFAAEKVYLEIVKLLLEKKEDTNAKDGSVHEAKSDTIDMEMYKALELAIDNNKIEVTKFLLDYGIEKYLTSRGYAAYIIETVIKKSFHKKDISLITFCIKKLIEEKVIPDTSMLLYSNNFSTYGPTLLTYSILRGNSEIIEIVLSRSLLSTIEESYKELEDIEERRGRDLSDKKRILEPILNK